MRQLGRGDDRRVGDVDAVVHLVFLLQSAQDGDGVLHRGFAHQHLLEAPLQRRVFLHVFAVFVQGGGADAMQFAARERGLQHIARVHGAFGLARADHGMQLVDEHDGLAFVLCQLFQHRFQPFLELAAIFGAGQERRHVERQHAFPLQGLGHFAVDDALRQALDDRGLAYAGFADQHRVVFGAPLQDLDNTADFVVAPDHRVELARARSLGQVQGVLFQRLAAAFGLGAGYVLRPAQGGDRLLQRLLAAARFLQQASGLALVLGQGEHEHLRGDELVAALLRRAIGQVQKVGQFARYLHFAALPFDLGQARDGALEAVAQARHVDPGAGKQRGRAAVLLRHQGAEQMHRFDVGVIVAHGQALRIGERLLKFGGEFVQTHC